MLSLRKAYQSMIKVQGLPDTATLMEMSESSLDNRVYERRGQEFTVRQALRMQQISGTTLFAQAVAEASGGVFVKMPEAGQIDNEDLLGKFNALYTKVGDLSRTYAEAVKDNKICEDEKRDLTGLGAELQQATQDLLALMFMLYCPQPAGKPSSANQ